jgi:tRNA U34 5-methylaminomethyl-2-thiouridine-forming methyltransferase MnmC
MFGAVGESKHVFIQNGLMTQTHRPLVSILEFGFGTGLNALLTYHFSLKQQQQVHYTGIEPFPIDFDIISRLDYAAYLAFPDTKDIFLQLHKEESFSSGSFQFSKIISLDQLPDSTIFDCIFFDAFAPADQPDSWTQPVFDLLYEKTTPEGCLVTYCAQGEVRRRMSNAGFDIQRLPGPPGKREMLRGWKR